jgi:hypothetical protein
MGTQANQLAIFNSGFSNHKIRSFLILPLSELSYILFICFHILLGWPDFIIAAPECTASLKRFLSGNLKVEYPNKFKEGNHEKKRKDVDGCAWIIFDIPLFLKCGILATFGNATEHTQLVAHRNPS